MLQFDLNVFLRFLKFSSTPNIIDSKVFAANFNNKPQRLAGAIESFYILKRMFRICRAFIMAKSFRCVCIAGARLSFFAVHRQLANGPPPENQTIEMESKKCCTIHQINRNSMTLCSSGTVYGCALSIVILMYRAEHTRLLSLFQTDTDSAGLSFHSSHCR